MKLKSSNRKESPKPKRKEAVPISAPEELSPIQSSGVRYNFNPIERYIYSFTKRNNSAESNIETIKLEEAAFETTTDQGNENILEVFDFYKIPLVSLKINEQTESGIKDNLNISNEIFDVNSQWDTHYSLDYIIASNELLKKQIKSENLILEKYFEDSIHIDSELIQSIESPTIYRIIQETLTKLLPPAKEKHSAVVTDADFNIYQKWDTNYSLGFTSSPIISLKEQIIPLIPKPFKQTNTKDTSDAIFDIYNLEENPTIYAPVKNKANFLYDLIGFTLISAGALTAFSSTLKNVIK